MKKSKDETDRFNPVRSDGTASTSANNSNGAPLFHAFLLFFLGRLTERRAFDEENDRVVLLDAVAGREHRKMIINRK